MSRVQDVAHIERGPFEMIPHWLLDADSTSLAVRLYLVLRRHGDASGLAFPGRRRLAELCHAGIKSVDRAKDELVALGAICYTRRHSESGDWTSNLYHVHWDRSLACTFFDATWGQNRPYPSVKNDPTPSVKNDTRTNTQLEPRPNEHDGFEQFWQVYPRKQNKGRARTAFTKALTKATIDEILEGARRYRDDPNREDQFTAHPSSWLNGERWTDEALPMRGQSRARRNEELATFAANFTPLQTQPNALESAQPTGEIEA